MNFRHRFTTRLTRYQNKIRQSVIGKLWDLFNHNTQWFVNLYKCWLGLFGFNTPPLFSITLWCLILVTPGVIYLLPSILLLVTKWVLAPSIAFFAEIGIFLFTNTYTDAEKYIKQNKKVFINLTKEEIAQAEHINELRDDLVLYKTLLEKFSKLDAALANRNNNQEDLDDNLIIDDFIKMQIKNPIIIFKEYQDNNTNKWHALPHTLKITCDAIINKLNWINPETKEYIKSEVLTHKNSITQQVYSSRYTIINYEAGLRPHILRELRVSISKQIKTHQNQPPKSANHNFFDGNNHSKGLHFFPQSSSNANNDLSLDINLSCK